MAGKNDLERYVRALVAKILDPTDGLNKYITAINTEFAGSPIEDPVLDLLDSDALSIQWLRDRVLNYSPFVMVYAVEGDGTGNGAETLKNYAINFELSFDDGGQDDTTGYRSYRYQRALEDFIESNWDKISDNVKSEITSLTPISYVLPDRQAPLIGVGVQIKFDIA